MFTSASSLSLLASPPLHKYLVYLIMSWFLLPGGDKLAHSLDRNSIFPLCPLFHANAS